MSEKFDARRLKPVTWDVDAPERVSVTLAVKADACPRDAALYLKYRGGASSGPLLRGSLAHLFVERLMTTLIETGEATLYAAQPGEDPLRAAAEVAQTTKDWVNELAEEAGWPISESDLDDVRQMAYHIAVGLDVDPQTVVAIERKLVLETPDGTLSGKVDLAALQPDGVLDVVDWKTAWAIPAQDDFDRMFQTPLYAALLLWGRQVSADGEVGEPLGELAGVQWARCRQIYPRFLSPDGVLSQREKLLGRADLRDSVQAAQRAMRRITRGVQKREWPAVSGPHCSMCTAEAECPLPRQLRRFAGAIQSVEQASEAMTWVRRTNALAAATRAEVVSFMKAAELPSLPVDAETFGFVVSHPRSLRRKKGEADWDGLQEAVEAAAEEGVPFHVNDWIRSRPRSEFKPVKVNNEEVEQDG